MKKEKSPQPDWSAVIRLIGILIKFLFKVIRDKKKKV